jgi:hypothetical protein
MSSLEARNMMVNWQVAPAGHELSNYDDAKIQYRESVQDIIHSLPAKSLKRFTFVIISTNVMCAAVETSVNQSRPHVEPIERDLYYPLEICLTKCSVSDMNKTREERTLKTVFWMLNPGPPPADGSVMWARDHKEEFHKIDYDKFRPNDTYIEKDIKKIVKEINSFLTPERLVFSTELRNCRQDLGCLKWLNRETNFIMKPVKVFSIEDLYVVLNRRMYPKLSQECHICQGVLRMRFQETADTYDPELQCKYHQDKLREDDQASTGYCAKSMTVSWAHVILDDIYNFKAIEEDLTLVSNVSSSPDLSAGH